MSNDASPDVCVVGLGYMGLPTAALAAAAGLAVHGVDRPWRLEHVRAGVPNDPEPGLAELVQEVLDHPLQISSEPVRAPVHLIVVPTPLGPLNRPDLNQVWVAVDEIVPFLDDGALVILESTSPVGTTEAIARRVRQARPDLTTLHFAYCPERALPGNTLHEIRTNDRVVGGVDAVSAERAAGFYRTFVQAEIHKTSARTAELCKLAENSARDVAIALANELSMVCDRHGIDSRELIRMANLHPRTHILTPGPGVGGHCLAIDPWFVVHGAPDLTPLLRTAREVNLSKTRWVVEKVESVARATGASRVLCLGFAYKPQVGDIRQSPALEVATQLAASFDVDVVDPFAVLPPDAPVSQVTLEQGLEHADLIVGLVAHAAFRDLPPEMLNARPLLDLCDLWPHLERTVHTTERILLESRGSR